MIIKVYNIEDYKIEVKGDNHGIRFSTDSDCPHRNLLFDENGQTVECNDCKKQVTAWWALMAINDGLNRMRERLEYERRELEKEKAKNVTHKAALKVEQCWRKRNMLPCCPHCLHAIRPEDGFGESMISKVDPENARRSMIRVSKVLGIATGEVK